jgi:hypothetical protein
MAFHCTAYHEEELPAAFNKEKANFGNIAVY